MGVRGYFTTSVSSASLWAGGTVARFKVQDDARCEAAPMSSLNGIILKLAPHDRQNESGDWPLPIPLRPG